MVGFSRPSNSASASSNDNPLVLNHSTHPSAFERHQGATRDDDYSNSTTPQYGFLATLLLAEFLSGIALCYFLGSLQSERQCACENYEEYDCSESEESSLRHVYSLRSESEVIRKLPNARIDGTQTPTKIPFRRSSIEASF